MLDSGASRQARASVGRVSVWFSKNRWDANAIKIYETAIRHRLKVQGNAVAAVSGLFSILLHF